MIGLKLFIRLSSDREPIAAYRCRRTASVLRKVPGNDLDREADWIALSAAADLREFRQENCLLCLPASRSFREILFTAAPAIMSFLAHRCQLKNIVPSHRLY